LPFISLGFCEDYSVDKDYYAELADDKLFELLFTSEDRLELAAAQEIARRDNLAEYLALVVMDKQSWLMELPDWWAVVHGVYILGLRGGEEAVVPLVAAMRWSDAFDSDWVTELLPSIFGNLGAPALPWLTALARDPASGWSVRDLALKGLAAIGLKHPETEEPAFKIIGERFMDEGEDPLLRQLAGQILLDFLHQSYRIALTKFARKEWAFGEDDYLYPSGLDPDLVEHAFRQGEPQLWHYSEDWMRFYDPGETQRRQKRWTRERLAGSRRGGSVEPPPGGGRVLPLWRHKGPESPPDSGPQG
jgi:hypothetical protein